MQLARDKTLKQARKMVDGDAKDDFLEDAGATVQNQARRDWREALRAQSRGSREATASSSDELRMCASMGISMLARAVELPGDPMQMQQKLDMKVAAFIGQLVKRVAKQREAAAAAKKEQARRREDERRAAEREADEERARKRMRLSVSGVVLVLMLLISCAMAFSQ